MKFKLLVWLHYHFEVINQPLLFVVCRGAGWEESCASHQLEGPRSCSACPVPLSALFKGLHTKPAAALFSLLPLSQEVLELSYISQTKVEQGILVRPAESGCHVPL